MSIDFFNTYVSPEAGRQVGDVLSSAMLSEGRITEQFEQEMCRSFGFKQFVALNSGTSALHLALDLLDVGKGDEVIIPAQTFIATGLAVLYCNATPVFADINFEDGNLNTESVRSKITPRTKAIISVHWGGYPCDMDGLKDLANSTGIRLVDDAAHALGATYKGAPIGTIADITCFSFQAIKHLTTGDGGAVTMNDPALYEKALRKKWFGIDRKNSTVSELGERRYDLMETGYKYHMNNYAAALGLANLKGYHERLKKRKELAGIYRQGLSGLKQIRLFREEADRQSAYWLFGFHTEDRIGLIRKLKEQGIPASVVHQRIDKYSIFGGVDHGLLNTERFDASQLHIPIHDAISPGQAAHVVEAIRQAV